MKEKFLTLTYWGVIYATCIGFILPWLFSAKSTVAVLIGVFLSILLIYRLISLVDFEKIIKTINKNN